MVIANVEQYDGRYPFHTALDGSMPCLLSIVDVFCLVRFFSRLVSVVRHC